MTQLSKSQILEGLRALSPEDRLDVLRELLKPDVDRSFRQTLNESRFAQGRCRPYCNSKAVVRYGHTAQTAQRYRCKECGKTFTASTGTLFSHARHPDLLRQYLHCMNLQLSLRQTAKVCKISLPTAFNMRHRILNILASAHKESQLDGIVEADETFFDLSFKGNHSHSTFQLPRAPHHRGHTQTQRGSCLHKVCLLTAIDRESDTFFRVSNLGTPTTSDVNDALHASMPAGTTLCTDRASSYITFAKLESLDLVQLRGGRISHGIFHIQNVNQLHSAMKSFLRPFHGVGTKYLSNDMTWLQTMAFRDRDGRKFESAAKLLEIALCTKTTRQVATRPAVPLTSTRQMSTLNRVMRTMQAKEEEAQRKLKHRPHIRPAVRRYPA